MSIAADKIEKCSAHMLLKYLWWGSLYLHLVRLETNSVDTMAVDGTHLFFNPNFTESLTDKECIGVLMHETAHCAFLHCYRRKYREPKRWNIACDKAVNAVLVAANITLPEDCVPAGPLGMLAEELYEHITPEEMALFSRDVLEAGSMDTAGEKSMTEKEWREALAGAHSLMPDFVARTVEEATAPQKDWKRLGVCPLRSLLRASPLSTRTWARQSRRIQKWLPGWSRELESNIVIVLDTSGSVTGPVLGAFAAACRAITALNGITAVIMSADAAVHQVIGPGGPFPTEWKGGGGTNFVPALRGISAELHYLFNGRLRDIPEEFSVPVLWALTQPRTVPFGEKILLEGIHAAENSTPH